MRTHAGAREDQVEEGQLPFGRAVEILTEHGMPPAWVDDPKNRKTITAWISSGVTAEQLAGACSKAADTKTRNGDGPIGVAYVAAVLRSMIQTTKPRGTTSEQFASQSYDLAGW